MFKQKYFLPAMICCALCSCRQPRQPASQALPVNGDDGMGQIMLPTGPAVDTARVHALLRAGHSIEKEAPQKALEYFNQALRVNNLQAYPEGQVMAYWAIEDIYSKRDNSVKADSFKKLEAAALLKIPSRFFNARQHQILKIYKLRYQAQELFIKGNLDSATAYYAQALNMLDTISAANYTLYIGCYLGLGGIAHDVANIAKAASYLDKAEAVARKYADSANLLSIIANKATLYLRAGRYEDARETGMEALRLSRLSGSIRNTAYSANTIAISFLKEHKPKEALPYSQMVLDAMSKADNTPNGYYILGYNYVELGAPEKAVNILLKGIRYAEQTGGDGDLANAYGQLSEAYDQLGNYKKAYKYRAAYSRMLDSIRGKEAAGRIAEVEAKYELSNKEKKLAEAHQSLLQKQLELSHQRIQLYIWIGGSSIFILLLLGLIYRRHSRGKYSRLKAALEGEEKERSRMARELHDGVINRLSLIKIDLSTLPEQHERMQMLQHLSVISGHLEESINELRTTSHNLLPDILVHAGLIEALKIYCDTVNSTSGPNVVFQVIGAIPTFTQEFNLNIYRILQELINNIIKHSDARNILVQLQVKDEWMTLTIDDDSDRAAAQHTRSGNGIGLHNLTQRVQLLNGSMQTEHNPGGNSTYLEFSIKNRLLKSINGGKHH